MSIHICPPKPPPPVRPMIRFEAVVTCVDYADYLAETLPLTKLVFDRVIVVTANEDAETRELCRRLSVPCYATGKFHDGGEAFNKARGITHGAKYLRYHDWVCHMDADTVVPPSAARWLRTKKLNPGCIYGVDRLNCVGWDRWQRYKQDAHWGHDYNCRVPFPPDMPMLERICLEDDGGWLPVGYFQLWHTSSGRLYPIADGTHATAERTDVAHATQWDERDRHLLGEFVAVHLQAAPAPLGANWRGRTTPRFGPTK